MPLDHDGTIPTSDQAAALSEGFAGEALAGRFGGSRGSDAQRVSAPGERGGDPIALTGIVNRIVAESSRISISWISAAYRSFSRFASAIAVSRPLCNTMIGVRFTGVSRDQPSIEA
jgi:hypothetical protein